MLLIWLIRKKTAMFNEFVLPVNFIKTPLTIGLTTSVLAGCSMMPSLPTNNTFGTKTVINTNNAKAPVRVRHAVPTLNNDNSNVGTLPLVVNQNGQNNQPLPNASSGNNARLLSGSKGKLWNIVINNEEANQLSNKQINANARERIEAEKQRWLTAQRNSLNTSLKSAPTYLHYLAYQAELRNLPTKLALLPLIESGYNPRAGKNAGANAPAGLWQIMPATATALNLKMNPSYDGRYDIVESTNTAYNYLGGLHRQYKSDWALALAAYNAGVPTVDKAIANNKAQGKPTDFWSLNLPKETMQYVPRFLALVDIIENSNRYGVELPFVDEVRQLQFIRVRNGATLDRIAPIASVPLETLKILNAGLLRDRIDTFTPRDIVLPFLVPANVIKQIEQLPINYTYNTPYSPPLDQPNEPANNRQPALPNRYPNQPAVNRPPRYDARQGNQFQPQNNTYVVQSGDTLSGLAQKFRVPRQVLARLNRVDMEYLLREGQKLQLPPNVNPNMGHISANRVKKNPRRKQHRAITRQKHMTNNGHYKVKEGDTLLGIANKLHTSARAIASLNGLDTEYLVKTGEILTVPVNPSQRAIAKKPNRPMIVHTTNPHSGKYQVISGDSLYSVARKFGLTQDQLARANNMDREDYLFTGQKINIPVNAKRMNLNKQVQASASKPAKNKAPKKKFQRAKGVKNYRVQSGDSLTKLARRYNVSLQTLAKMNDISPLSDLYAGTTIKVPKKAPSRNMTAPTGQTEYYKVKEGEGLIKLAKRFNISVNELAKMNGVSATDNLRLGQELVIPRH